MKEKISNITIECIKGNIACQPDIIAIVNAANRELRPGGGVAGAIHWAAGPDLDLECRQHAPISTGQAVITGAYNLPNKYVIHCLGPVYGRDIPEEKLLYSCYTNAFNLAEENHVESVAFPAISAGIFGYPIRDACRVAFNSLSGNIKGFKNIRLVRFVLYSESDLHIYEQALKDLTANAKSL